MSSRPSRLFSAALACAAVLAAAWAVFRHGGSRPAESVPPRALSFTAMGTVGELLIPAATPLAPAEETAAFAAVRDAVERCEAEFSIYRPESIVSRMAAGESVPLSDSGARLFSLAETVVRASDGAYDPTVGPLMRLWGFRGGDRLPSEPAPDALRTALDSVGWSHVIETDGQTARQSVPNARLDFGGVAKGFAVDEAFAILRKTHPDTGFLVNLGGNMRAWGIPRPGAAGWTIAVRDPFLPLGGGSVGTLLLTNSMAVATSGCYEQFVEIRGVRYTHILDPRDGRPIRGLAQITVVASSAAVADALSTACFVLGPDASRRLLAAFPGASAFFIPDQEHGGLAAATTLGAAFPWLSHPE